MTKRRCAVTDKEKLKLAITLTTQFEFGSLCDQVDLFTEIPASIRENIKAKIRTRGNNIIRVSSNHIDAHNVTRKTTNTPVDANSIADRLQKEG